MFDHDTVCSFNAVHSPESGIVDEVIATIRSSIDPLPFEFLEASGLLWHINKGFFHFGFELVLCPDPETGIVTGFTLRGDGDPAKLEYSDENGRAAAFVKTFTPEETGGFRYGHKF